MRIGLGELSFDVRSESPSQGPAVLLLHGFPENGLMWTEVAARLHESGLHTVVPDQRGYSPGARPTDVEAYRVSELVQDVLGLLDALQLPAVHLVGHDWGAVVAWQLAARHPDRVQSLTAVSVPHPVAHASALVHDEEQRERSTYIQLFRVPDKAEDLLLADDARRLRALLVPLSEDQVEAFVRPMQQPGALTAALSWYRAMSRADLDGLGPVTVPTTYLWGTEDQAVAPAAAHGCAQQVTGRYRFMPLEGVSHWVPEQHPDIVADAILDQVASTA